MSSKREGPGLAKATRGSHLRERFAGAALSRQAEESLFACAEVMSEGSVREGPEGATYFGSTMLTIDLGAFQKTWRGTLEGAALERFRRVVEGSVRVKLRAMRIACAEAAHRVPNRRFGTAAVETVVHVRQSQLHIDVDVEVPLDEVAYGSGQQ